ncbi:hypothetical protein JHK82_039345 [Glycine max]|nr:hypothetical protein JHK86_039527 [Glycine max]KAG4965130.1 hypothetical protein JHK85_040105 [Glycine max]KAG5110122.1 hypothetical protein JHK82_039345 [Glycine max]
MDINENENEDEDILKVFPEERNFKNSNLKKKKQLMNIEEAKYWMTRDLEQCLWGQILDLHRPNDMVNSTCEPKEKGLSHHKFGHYWCDIYLCWRWQGIQAALHGNPHVSFKQHALGFLRKESNDWLKMLWFLVV